MKNLFLVKKVIFGSVFFVSAAFPTSIIDMGSMVALDGKHYFLKPVDQEGFLEDFEQQLNYRGHKVSDLECSQVLPLKKVLHKIQELFQKNTQPKKGLTLVLSENYLTEVGFSQLVTFLTAQENRDIVLSLALIDLSNNRIRSSAQNDIKNVLEKFPHLSIDISINYLSMNELTDIPENMKQRIIIR